VSTHLLSAELLDNARAGSLTQANPELGLVRQRKQRLRQSVPITLADGSARACHNVLDAADAPSGEGTG